MIMIKRGFVLLFFLISPSRFSEYRVYQYSIKNLNSPLKDRKGYMITSTLDPISFLAYHGGPRSLSLDLMRTWMCFGSTAQKKICPSLREEFDLEINKENPFESRRPTN